MIDAFRMDCHKFQAVSNFPPEVDLKSNTWMNRKRSDPKIPKRVAFQNVPRYHQSQPFRNYPGGVIYQMRLRYKCGHISRVADRGCNQEKSQCRLFGSAIG